MVWPSSSFSRITGGTNTTARLRSHLKSDFILCCRYHIIGRAGLGANPPSEDVIQEIIYQDQAGRERRKYTDAGTQTPTSLSIGDQLDRDDEDYLLPVLSYQEEQRNTEECLVKVES